MLLQAITSQIPKSFILMLLLSEGRAVKPWEPTNKVTPPHKTIQIKVSITSAITCSFVDPFTVPDVSAFFFSLQSVSVR
jgi:hypothetical protein